MRVSIGLPGKHRKDKQLSATVKVEHSLGQGAGKWIKDKYPDWALEPLEKVATEAREYHAQVTLPFDAGIGILPAGLIVEYGERMAVFRDRFDALIKSHFEPKYPQMVDWARVEHNGTFDEADYPEVAKLVKKFYFRTEPVPVPDADHYEDGIKSLLGVDADSVNLRVSDAMVEAQKELMRRLIEPVRAMAVKLAEQPKEGKQCPVFRDTLIGNVMEIAAIAPKLNIAGDADIDAFVKEVEGLTRYTPDGLRKSGVDRSAAASAAADVTKRMEAYAGLI
jgi:hypothetical protein